MAELEDDLRMLAQRAVEASAEASTHASPGAPGAAGEPRRRRRSLAVAATVVVLVIVIAGAIGVAFARRDDRSGQLTTAPTATDQESGLICGNTIATSFPAITSSPDTLVSSAPLRSVTVCRYGGLNTPSPDGTPQVGRLQQSGTVTDAATMSALVDAVDAGEPVPAGAISCPADFGIYYVVGFSYVDAPLDFVLVGGSGCRFVQRDSAGHWASPSSSPPSPQSPGSPSSRCLAADSQVVATGDNVRQPGEVPPVPCGALGRSRPRRWQMTDRRALGSLPACPTPTPSIRPRRSRRARARGVRLAAAAARARPGQRRPDRRGRRRHRRRHPAHAVAGAAAARHHRHDGRTDPAGRAHQQPHRVRRRVVGVLDGGPLRAIADQRHARPAAERRRLPAPVPGPGPTSSTTSSRPARSPTWSTSRPGSRPWSARCRPPGRWRRTWCSWCPSADVLFAGAMCSFGTTPNAFDGDPGAWADSLADLGDMATTIVPGIGPIGGADDVLALQAYLWCVRRGRGRPERHPRGSVGRVDRSPPRRDQHRAGRHAGPGRRRRAPVDAPRHRPGLTRPGPATARTRGRTRPSCARPATGRAPRSEPRTTAPRPMGRPPSSGTTR